jgi:heptosyltransferase-3
MSPRILVIRGGAIGDFILTLPAIRLLRENFPRARLEILGYKHIVALAHGRFYADDSRSIEYGPLAPFFIPNAQLAPELMAFFGGFNQVVSYLFDPDRIFENNLRRCGVKNLIAGSPKIDDSQHAAYQLARPLQTMALYLENPAAIVHPAPEDREFAAEFLGAFAPPLVAIHPGSGSERKNWPLENWVALCRWLGSLTPALTLLLIGGEADRQRLSALRQAQPAMRVASDLPLSRLAAVLEKCALFIGHDSGISHLAAAAQARCLLLFGPTDPDIWAPANPGVRILRAPGGALENLALETVKNAAETALRASAEM